MDEVKDFEIRRRYRKYLTQQGKYPKEIEETQSVTGKAVTERIASAGSVTTAGPSKSNTSAAPERREPLTQSPNQPLVAPSLAEGEDVVQMPQEAVIEASSDGVGDIRELPSSIPSTPARPLEKPPRRRPRDTSSPPDMYTTDGFASVGSRRQDDSSPPAVSSSYSRSESTHIVLSSEADLPPYNADPEYTSPQSLQRRTNTTPRQPRSQRRPRTPDREPGEHRSEMRVTQEVQSATSKAIRERSDHSSASQSSRRIVTRSATKVTRERARLPQDLPGHGTTITPDHGSLRRNRHHPHLPAMPSSSPAQIPSPVQSSLVTAQGSSLTDDLVSHESNPLDFEIYDDSRPSASQPQTPQQLPEARHRSRILPAYTAPAGNPAGTNRHSRRRALFSRSRSPEGLEIPGFRGLFGGTENRDEETLFEEALNRITELRGEGRDGDETQG